MVKYGLRVINVDIDGQCKDSWGELWVKLVECGLQVINVDIDGQCKDSWGKLWTNMVKCGSLGTNVLFKYFKFKMAASSSEVGEEDGRLENFMQEVTV